MGILFFGILALVLFMLVVMGVPLIHYLKRDARWMSDCNRSVETWYK